MGEFPAKIGEVVSRIFDEKSIQQGNITQQSVEDSIRRSLESIGLPQFMNRMEGGVVADGGGGGGVGGGSRGKNSTPQRECFLESVGGGRTIAHFIDGQDATMSKGYLTPTGDFQR